MAVAKPATAPAKPIQLKKGGPTTEPSPTLLTRNIKRHVAVCIANVIVTDCEFPNRAKPLLHSSAAGAEVESARHLRETHKELLSLEVKAQRKRQVVNEQIELVAEE